MGFIDNFMKRIGLKPKQDVLPKGEPLENASSSVSDDKPLGGDHFNESLKVNPTSSFEIIGEIPPRGSETEQKKEPVLKVFAEKGIYSTEIDYVVKLETENGNLIPISIIKGKKEGMSLKDIVGQISRVVSTMQNNAEQGNDPKKQEKLKEQMALLGQRYNINFTRSMINMMENSRMAHGINYQKFDDLLPRTIDMSSLTPEQIVQYGRTLTQRLGVLDSIKTPEDAYKARESLESFMKSQERQTSQSIIIDANLENLESSEQALDIPTIIAFAKKMETVTNEDGMLYSSYLKLEENRIIRKLQKEIETYKSQLGENPENISTHQTIEFLLDYLESNKIHMDDDREDNIVGYMIDTLQGKGIENYAKNLVKNDIRLKVFLQHNPIEHQTEALDYVVSKMACFGQVVATPESEEYVEKIKRLRDFIELTDFKDEDDSESKNFLYTVVQIERDYIKKNYSPILHEFQKIVDGQSK